MCNHSSLQNGWTALIGAALKGQTDVCKYLIDQGADVNIQSEVSLTLLVSYLRTLHFFKEVGQLVCQYRSLSLQCRNIA